MQEARGKIVSGQKESMTLVRINKALCDSRACKQKQKKMNYIYFFVCLFVLVILKS